MCCWIPTPTYELVDNSSTFLIPRLRERKMHSCIEAMYLHTICLSIYGTGRTIIELNSCDETEIKASTNVLTCWNWWYWLHNHRPDQDNSMQVEKFFNQWWRVARHPHTPLVRFCTFFDDLPHLGAKVLHGWPQIVIKSLDYSLIKPQSLVYELIQRLYHNIPCAFIIRSS